MHVTISEITLGDDDAGPGMKEACYSVNPENLGNNGDEFIFTFNFEQSPRVELAEGILKLTIVGEWERDAFLAAMQLFNTALAE